MSTLMSALWVWCILRVCSSVEFITVSLGTLTGDSDSIYDPYPGASFVNPSSESLPAARLWVDKVIFDNVTEGSFENITLFYEDIDELNDIIQQEVPGQTVVGNIIFCLSGCANTTIYPRIGPEWEMHADNYMFLPISMNSNFNFNQTILSGNDTSRDIIYISALYYAIDVGNVYEIQPYMEEFIFPNGEWAKTAEYFLDSDQYFKYGYYVYSYDNITNAYDDLGATANWSSLYEDWYHEVSYDTFILYIFGLSVQCSNDKICEEFINYTPPSPSPSPNGMN